MHLVFSGNRRSSTMHCGCGGRILHILANFCTVYMLYIAENSQREVCYSEHSHNLRT